MADYNGPKDYDRLREALQHTEAAEFGDLDDQAIKEILHAVEESEWLAGWEQPGHKEQSPQEDRLARKARKLERAARDFQLALDEAESGRLYHASPTLSALKSLLPELLVRLEQLPHHASDRAGSPRNPEKFLVERVSRVVRRYGHERQEPEFEDEPDPSQTGRHMYHRGLRNDAHLVLVIREVLKVIGIPTKLPDETLLRYARAEDSNPAGLPWDALPD